MSLYSAILPLPLFDRLGGTMVAHSGVCLTGRAAMQLSLQHEMARLFSARNGLSIAQFLDGEMSTLQYGLPDMLGLSSQSTIDLARWEQVIARAIVLNEPRLIQVRVKVMPDAVSPTVVRVIVSGAALVGRALCPFDFDAPLNAMKVGMGDGGGRHG